MLETAIIAFTTFFATVGPIDVAVIYAAISHNNSREMKRAMALRGCFIAFVILLFFALAGDSLLRTLGISLPALKFAGGILLLLIAIDLVFARQSGANATEAERRAAIDKEDVSVFPLATPLIAGPGSMSAVVLLMVNARDDVMAQVMVVSALVAVLLVTLALLLLANQVQRLFGETGIHAISRVFGVLLAALSVQFMFDGLAQSGLF
jgi:multiple antibiotic resistance protein